MNLQQKIADKQREGFSVMPLIKSFENSIADLEKAKGESRIRSRQRLCKKIMRRLEVDFNESLELNLLPDVSVFSQLAYYNLAAILMQLNDLEKQYHVVVGHLGRCLGILTQLKYDAINEKVTPAQRKEFNIFVEKFYEKQGEKRSDISINPIADLKAQQGQTASKKTYSK